MAAESDMCWICLEEASEDGSHELMSPCKCPRKVHPQCLARWQLQQAGRHEEKFCRFCNNELADWKRHLTPEELKPEVSKVQPIMVVYFEGQIHRIPVKQGPDGLDEFTGKIRELFRLPEDVDISLTFGCKEPMSGTHLKLEGMGAFDAAVHCASVAAAERQQKIKKSYSTGNLGAVPTLADGTGRSASINNIPGGSPRSGDSPSDSSALSPATPPPAAGASAAGAAQDRRQRFPAQPNHRSRSFSAFSGSGPRSTGVEQPAAFRNILGMLNGNSAQAPAGEPGAAGAPQASPRSGLPPAGAVRFAEPPAAVTAQPSRSRSRGLSLRNISQTQLKDVPEVDETVAVGSLSGKFKLSFKAFSRKVARGLSFTSKDSKSSAAAGSSGPSFSATSMEQLPALSAGNRDSFSITSNSSSRVESFSAPTAAAGVAMPGRAASPLPPATPPSIYSC